MSEVITIQMPVQPAESRDETSRAQAWAHSLMVSDAESRKAAASGVSALKRMAAQVKELFGDSKKAAHEAHKTICAAERKMLAPIEDATSKATDKIMAYDRAESKRLEEERKKLQVEAEARAEAERRRLEALAARCTRDATKREAYTEAATEVIATPVEMAQADDRAQGEVRSMRWTARLDSLDKVIKAAAEGDVNAGALLQFNQVAANRLAVSLRKAGEIVPGVVFEKVSVLGFRR